MTKENFKSLNPGDLICHKNDTHAYTVVSNLTRNDQQIVTIQFTMTATHPEEWILVGKVQYDCVMDDE